LTDSGGIQEETTVLGVPCITLRDTTERPVTVTEGTNIVTGLDQLAVVEAAQRALRAEITPRRPELWDGQAATRIVNVLRAALAG
jgi:UDP-N-acetylglucosamine 2-epimerase (non-hydrolysing)